MTKKFLPGFVTGVTPVQNPEIELELVVLVLVLTLQKKIK